jgi:hypothetical protein
VTGLFGLRAAVAVAVIKMARVFVDSAEMRQSTVRNTSPKEKGPEETSPALSNSILND